MCEGCLSSPEAVRIVEQHERSATETLRKLISRELGVCVKHNELRLFVLAHWGKLSKLAHEIHERGY
jgi:hypothetical protein